MKLLLPLLFVFSVLVASSQVQDDFSDGDLSRNPAWTGDTGHFVVNSDKRLQLDAPAVNGRSYLTTESAVCANASWQFTIHLGFNPSSVNYARVYLVSDHKDPAEVSQAVFVQVGSATDDVALYHLEGLKTTKILTGPVGLLNRDSATIGVRITLDSLNGWQLFTDSLATGDFRLQGSFQSAHPQPLQFLSLQMVYTSTRSRLFWIDNILVTGDTLVPLPYAPLAAGDVIFTEIMADPTPSRGLPEAEYLEIFNRSDKEISLSRLTLHNNDKRIALPDSLLKPGQTALLCDEEYPSEFLPFAPVIPVAGWAAILNGDAVLELTAQGTMIDRLHYFSGLYGTHESGGYSLELTDAALQCRDHALYWQPSKASAGGSPGVKNALPPGGVLPVRISSLTYQDSILRVRFNQPVIPLTAWNIAPEVSLVELSPPGDETQLWLQPDSHVVYTLSNDSLKACNHSGTYALTTGFSLPQTAQGRLMINEVYFNPSGEGVDFIELYNRSGDWVGMKGLAISGAKNENVEIQHENHILAPYGYLLLSSDKNALVEEFEHAITDSHIALNDMPGLPDDKGQVILRDGNAVIDSVSYSEAMHSDNLTTTEGVSLERLSLPGFPVYLTSASSLSGYATPGLKNSHVLTSSGGEDILELSAPAISPDNDGINDVLLITVRPTKAGPWSGNVEVFDLRGRRMQTLALNENFGSENLLVFNGGGYAPGNYIVHCRLYNRSGQRLDCKKSFAISL